MTLRTRPTDLVAFLRRVTLAFTSRAERARVTLSFHTEEDAIPMEVDHDKLEKVFYNLLSNAFKFTAPGGKIRLDVERVVQDGQPWVAVQVKDTGQGIPASELPHVFDRFYQVDGSAARAHEGTGIGLALVKELVDLHGGSIGVESEIGFGSTFTVRLPAAPVREGAETADPIEEETAFPDRSWLLEEDVQPDAPSDAAPAEAAGAEPGRASILVVDDNADMRAYLRDRLGGRYRVREARDGVEGLEQARAEPPDLVLADVMMPRMDGYALCRAIRQDAALSHIPVVLLTAKADDVSKREGLEQGADDYLTKPFNAEELALRVENLIELRRRLRRRFSGEVVITPGEIAVPSAAAAFLEELRTIVEEDLGDPTFGVKELAERMGMSRRQLRRRLQAAVDLSPSGYIRMARLERAAQLLEREAGRVSEVAYRVGFGSPEHFSRVFRQVFGVPPSAYPVDSADHLTESDKGMTKSDGRDSSRD